uniref:Uncharacterized protein n=1 Tax=Haemonchus contortus TaxID=6289 RepID=A0A7I4XY55_HAECO
MGTHHPALTLERRILRTPDQIDQASIIKAIGRRILTIEQLHSPSSEALQMETNIQIPRALQSSHELTERYWEKWRTHYLAALREQTVRASTISQQQERRISSLTNLEHKVKETWDHCLQKQEEIKSMLKDFIKVSHSVAHPPSPVTPSRRSNET